MSFGIKYNKEKFSLKLVENTKIPFITNKVDDIVYLAWYDVDGIDINIDDTLFYLIVENIQSDIAISDFELVVNNNEVANKQAGVVQQFNIVIPTYKIKVNISDNTTSQPFIVHTFDNQITLHFKSTFSGNISLYNIEGKKVFEQNIQNREILSIPIKNLSQGIYTLKIYDTTTEVSYNQKVSIIK